MSDPSKIDAVVNAIKQSFKDQLKNQGVSNIMIERNQVGNNYDISNTIYEDWKRLSGLKDE